jgi:predicted TIM-barrel fold metal-dependent hydrolase
VTELGFKGAIIHGHTNGRFLDHKNYWSTFEAAESLRVPLYLHPTPPTKTVFDAYYSDLDSEVADVLSTSGWGWHAETGLHALRLIVSGVFDRFPALQVVIGHMGENVPFSLARADSTLGRVTTYLNRSISAYFTENFYITTSGYFTHPPLLCALMVVGADRVLFSVDYPFSQNAHGRAFLDSAPISAADRAKVAYLNADRLLRFDFVDTYLDSQP